MRSMQPIVTPSFNPNIPSSIFDTGMPLLCTPLGGYSIDNSHIYNSLEELIQHYTNSSDGLCCKLTVVCPPRLDIPTPPAKTSTLSGVFSSLHPSNLQIESGINNLDKMQRLVSKSARVQGLEPSLPAHVADPFDHIIIIVQFPQSSDSTGT